MVYTLFSKWHFPSLGRTMPPSLPSPAKWKPASVENTSRRVTFLQPIWSWEMRSKTLKLQVIIVCQQRYILSIKAKGEYEQLIIWHMNWLLLHPKLSLSTPRTHHPINAFIGRCIPPSKCGNCGKFTLNWVTWEWLFPTGSLKENSFFSSFFAVVVAYPTHSHLHDGIKPPFRRVQVSGDLLLAHQGVEVLAIAGQLQHVLVAERAGAVLVACAWV